MRGAVTKLATSDQPWSCASESRTVVDSSIALQHVYHMLKAYADRV